MTVYNVQAAAEKNRLEQTEKELEKIKQMNARVNEAQTKRSEMETHDFSQTEAKMQSADERREQLIKETQDKAAAEVAKVRSSRRLESFLFVRRSYLAPIPAHTCCICDEERATLHVISKEHEQAETRLIVLLTMSMAVDDADSPKILRRRKRRRFK